MPSPTTQFTKNRRSPSGKLIPAGFESVATLAALAALECDDADPGVQCYVASLQAYFTMTAGLALTAVDGITTIAALNRTGYYWIREEAPVENNPWTKIVDWYVNYLTGNDENYGSAALPVKTWSEIARRLGKTPRIHYVVTVHILSDLPEVLGLGVDPVFTDYEAGIVFTASPKTVHFNGTIQSWTSCTPGVQGVMTDAGVADFSAHVGRRIRITSGAMTGFSTFIGGLGAAVTDALVGQLAWRTGTNRGNMVVSDTDPGDGATYNIESLFSVLGVSVRCSNYVLDTGSFTLFLGWVVENLDVRGSAYSGIDQSIQTDGVTVPSFISCAIGASITGRSVALYGCEFGRTSTPVILYGLDVIDTNVIIEGHSGGAPEFINCLVGGAPTKTSQFTGGPVYFTQGTRSQSGFDFNVYHGANLPGVSIDETSDVNLGVVVGVLTNAGALADGLVVNGRAWYTTKPNITPGAGGVDTVIGGTTKAYADVPYVEPTNNAMLVAKP